MLDRSASDEGRHGHDGDPEAEHMIRAEMRAPVDAPRNERAQPATRTPARPTLEDVLDREVGHDRPPEYKRPWWRRVLLIGVPLLVIAAGLWLYLSGGRYVSEDDAYVEALNISVSSQVAGKVVAVDVHSNEEVQKGQVLFQIDRVPYRIALDQADAQLGQARAKVQDLVQTYRAQVQQINQAKAALTFARATADRQRKLLKRGAATKAAADQAQRDLETAQANFAAAQRKAAAVLAQLDGNADLPVDQQPVVRQALANVAAAKQNLADTTVQAPIGGIVTKVESIGPGSYLAPGQAAFPIVSTRDVWIEANVKETDLTYVRPGDSATITVDTYPNRQFTGKVTTIAPASGAIFALLPPQNATGNWVKVTQRLPVRVSVDRPPGSPELRAGMSANVSIDTGHKRSLSDLWRDVTGYLG